MYACHVLFLSSMQDALTVSVSFMSYRIGSRLREKSNSLPVFDAENSRHDHNDPVLRGQFHGADPNNSTCLGSSVHPTPTERRLLYHRRCQVARQTDEYSRLFPATSRTQLRRHQYYGLVISRMADRLIVCRHPPGSPGEIGKGARPG
jgi:hypothetical protein